MTKGKSFLSEPEALRRKAEERAGAGAPPPPNEADAKRLVHELQVHQIELQMQNEELLHARSELEGALSRYAELFDFAPIGYATVTTDGVIREINHAGARLLGQARGLLVGQQLGLLLAADSQRKFADLVARTVTCAVTQTAELERELPDDTQCLRLHASAIRQPDILLLLAFEDVTEAKRREEQLRLAEESLREAGRHKDEFLATLSHELRNPLAPIGNCLFLLSRVEPGGEQAKKALAIMDRQVTHLTRLVDDILDVTRITRGKIQLQRQNLELGDLVRKTIEDHRASFEAAGIDLWCRFEPGLYRVHGDSARLVQVLSNLLGNAVKFTSHGGSVTVTLERDEDEAVIGVTDTGVGISADVLDHLFEPFTQAPQSIDRAHGGLGLGLATVKGLIELHGGTVLAASAGQNRGASITVRLPLVEWLSERRSRPASGRPRVLVIEDSVDAAEGLKAVLDLAGYDVSLSHDGPSGLEQAHRTHPDVILCDIGLQGMDGYELARLVRADEELSRTYLVALTGYAQPEDLDRAMASGFDQHVAKPATVEELCRILDRVPTWEARSSPDHAAPA